jgi:hypothetical protein
MEVAWTLTQQLSPVLKTSRWSVRKLADMDLTHSTCCSTKFPPTFRIPINFPSRAKLE